MSNVFFCADTHFGHEAILEFEKKNRPFFDIHEHDRVLIDNWNRVVGPRDVVWHLGDLAWHEDDLFHVLPQLNGRIKLVLGNHDTFPSELYLSLGVESVHGCVKYKHNILLTHVPSIINQDYERFRWNVHGHIHGKPAPTERHICVSMEHINLAPISLNDIKRMIDGRTG